MLVTNIPPLVGASSPPVENKKDDQKQTEVKKKLPKIRKYCSLVMKNFYNYSNQNRVITKNTGRNSLNEQYCKTTEEREQEVKDLEDRVNNFYEEMKKKEEEQKTKQENYYTQIQEMNDKFIEGRQKMINNNQTATGNLLDEVILKNNNSLSFGKEIEELYFIINQDLNINEDVSDDVLFEWYSRLKAFITSINNKEYSLSVKYVTMVEEMKKKLGEIFVKKTEIILKPENKTKPDITKKYKEIEEENLLIFDEAKETKAILEKIKQ